MDSQAETYSAIKSMLALLDDPFTSLFEPSRFAALKGGTAGCFQTHVQPSSAVRLVF